MPEPPDFDQIARTVLASILQPTAWTEPVDRSMVMNYEAASIRAVAEQLRLVWNARGAADLAQLEATIPGAYTKRLDHALRDLDR